jgi:hypothetical protein
MTEDKSPEIAKNLSLSMMKVNARCDALETLVVLLGEAVGWPKEKTEQCLREFSGISYAHRLESVEKQMGQSFAASIDDRPLLNPSDYSDL